jgi:alpha-galactosidase
LYGTQTIDEYGRLVPNVSQFPSAAHGQGFAPLSKALHAKGLKMGIWIGGGVPRMAVEARSPVKGTRWTAADIAIVDGRPNKDGKATGTMDCPWNQWLLHGINHTHPGASAYMASLAELYVDDWSLDFLKVGEQGARGLARDMQFSDERLTAAWPTDRLRVWRRLVQGTRVRSSSDQRAAKATATAADNLALARHWHT